MKNIIIKISSIALVLLVCGCSKDKYITCTNEINNEFENYELRATYKIYYKDSYVTKIEKKEKYTSSDKKVIDYFEEYKDLDYSYSKDVYGGYDYTIKKNKDYVEIKTTIDMNLVDIKSMVRDGKLDKDYVISNKLTTSGAQYYYKSIGAECSEE